jgi:hypothetical protein
LIWRGYYIVHMSNIRISAGVADVYLDVLDSGNYYGCAVILRSLLSCAVV